MAQIPEHQRLAEVREGIAPWKKWGPYLSERAWGTVREDYSPSGDAWDYLPHDHARSKAYRWNEDGLAGICDNRQHLCFALALWNGHDPILKERLFGLTGTEGNHGEDVKECYFYLDSTPTHSYMKMLYKYPQRSFPYESLVTTNRARSRQEPEFELIDTGAFAEGRYFDVFVEYAKAAPEDILIRIGATNRSAEPAQLDILPTVWFRNTWSWGDSDEMEPRPSLHQSRGANAGYKSVVADHHSLGRYRLAAEGEPDLLFCDNETNQARLHGVPNTWQYTKDGINDCVVSGARDRVNGEHEGTKAAAHYRVEVGAGATVTLRLRLQKIPAGTGASDTHGDGAGHGMGRSPFEGFDMVFEQRRREADSFYAALQPETLTEDQRQVQRQALAGMLWSKQFYHYDVDKWLRGDPLQPPPDPGRKAGRNHEWLHFNSADIISMPDKWEYPWFAAWDLAFHCVTLALVDTDFAKEQLILLGREWYQHPNGQIPAYEWNFSDVNPPVLAWAAWRVYEIEQQMRGGGDRTFLERVFHKLLLNFTWWVNRKDAEGRNVFQGGFLGLDNIGVFDRSSMLPTSGHIEQSDGTAWMGMFCLNMLRIAVELAQKNEAYEDIATKFFEHFLYIAEAMNNVGDEGISLWDDGDEFFYDALHCSDSGDQRLKVRSIVGLIPLFAVTTLAPELREALPEFKRHQQWFLKHRPKLAGLVSRWQEPGMHERRLLAILRGHRMKRVLRRMLDESEFLSPYGVRALSRYHAKHPYVLHLAGMNYEVKYQPAESDTALFGGNSNWRGPIWFPVNYLIIEALRTFHRYYGDDFKVECPTGSGQYLTLREIASELAGRLTRIFLRNELGRRPVFGEQDVLQNDPHWRDYISFHEYFHGDNGAGLGASHQTGWTGLVANLIQEEGEARRAILSDPVARGERASQV